MRKDIMKLGGERKLIGKNSWALHLRGGKRKTYKNNQYLTNQIGTPILHIFPPLQPLDHILSNDIRVS